MSIITARLNNDTDIYSGPGESYESIDHILSEGVLNVYYSEGDWYYVSCPADSLVFNTDTVYGYVHGSVLIDMSGIPNDNQTYSFLFGAFPFRLNIRKDNPIS